MISSKIRLILSGRPTRTARTPSFRRPMAMLSTAGLPRQETTGATTDANNGSFKNKNIGISLRNFEILANWMRRMSEICSLTENSSAIRCDPQLISTWLGIPWKRSSPVAPTGDLQLFSPNSSNHVLERNHMFDTLVYDNPIVDTYIYPYISMYIIFRHRSQSLSNPPKISKKQPTQPTQKPAAPRVCPRSRAEATNPGFWTTFSWSELTPQAPFLALCRITRVIYLEI